MNIVQELEKLYDEIDLSYADQEYEANRKGYNRKEASIKNKRSINDHSYFLMVFTRMEDRVKSLAKKLIQDKSNDHPVGHIGESGILLKKEIYDTKLGLIVGVPAFLLV